MPGLVDINTLRANATKTSILSRKIKFVPGEGDRKKDSNPLAQVSYQSDIHNPKTDHTHQELTKFLNWSHSSPIGPGLVNIGNTCFLNSVLQCLAYTPPFTQYLLSKPHVCQYKSSCTLFAMEEHLKKSVTKNNASSSSFAFVPKSILSRLKWISKKFRLGRQEDAHEFLLYLLESMQKACFHNTHAPSKESQKKLIPWIFGGKVQSCVTCLQCKTESKTHDPLLDICLDIKHANTIEKAFSFFNKTELLTGANRYHCEK